MYAAEVDGRRLVFSVSGLLVNRSLIMYEAETDSCWSHLLGLCLSGSLKGRELEMLPSVMTDWATWRKVHPKTTAVLLSRTSANYKRDFFRQPAKFVIGVVGDAEAKAWPFDQLLKQKVVNDRLGDEPLLIAFDSESVTAFVYRRTLDGKEITFSLDDKGRLRDAKTNSTWDIASGKALSGDMMGRRLERAIGIVSYRRPWKLFHPESKYWSAGEEAAEKPASKE